MSSEENLPPSTSFEPLSSRKNGRNPQRTRALIGGKEKPRKSEPNPMPTTSSGTAPSSREPASSHRRLPKAAVASMKEWLHANTHNPFPTEEKKLYFSTQFGLTMVQVGNWFINARRRYLPGSSNGNGSSGMPIRSRRVLGDYGQCPETPAQVPGVSVYKYPYPSPGDSKQGNHLSMVSNASSPTLSPVGSAEPADSEGTLSAEEDTDEASSRGFKENHYSDARKEGVKKHGKGMVKREAPSSFSTGRKSIKRSRRQPDEHSRIDDPRDEISTVSDTFARGNFPAVAPVTGRQLSEVSFPHGSVSAPRPRRPMLEKRILAKAVADLEEMGLEETDFNLILLCSAAIFMSVIKKLREDSATYRE